jgi:hypothetical protein
MRYLLSALACAVVIAACTTQEPGTTGGTLSGHVTLSGGGQIPSTGRLLLYRSPADVQLRRDSTEVVNMTAVARTFSFKFDNLTPGIYYLNACFSFGCGFYQVGNGQPSPATVHAGGHTVIDFTL